MIWLYFLSGALALYSVETAEFGQAWHITAGVAFLLCLVPAALDAMLASGKAGRVFSLRKKQA